MSEYRDSDNSIRPLKFLNEKVMPSISSVDAGMLPVMEIFRTIEGEGLHVGTPRVLARLGGCAVRCVSCDTKHSWTLKTSTMMTNDEFVAAILAEVKGNVQQVSITGGEPLHYPRQLLYVVPELRKQRLNVSVETSGVVINEPVLALFDYVSMDIKSPSSGVPVSARMLQEYENLWNWHGRIQFKVVILDEQDLMWVEKHLSVFYKTNPTVRSPLILTPGVKNTQAAQKSKTLQQRLLEIVDMISDWNKCYNIRVIPQVHQLLHWR